MSSFRRSFAHLLQQLVTATVPQVAVKTHVGVFYFTDTIPLSAVTVACEVSQQDWLAKWKEFPVRACVRLLFEYLESRCAQLEMHVDRRYRE